MAYFNKKRKGTANFMRGNVGGGFETRGQQDDPIDQSGYGPAPTAPIGQMQAPISTFNPGQSAIESVDWYTNWDNMGDIYDDFSAYNQAQTQWDWFSQNLGTSDSYGPGTQAYDAQLAAWEQAQSDYGTGYTWWNLYGPGSNYGSGGGNPMTGGSQGGFGDLGQGSAFDPGFTNPFGEGWGPEGQYEGNAQLDPDWNPWGDQCWDQYMAMGDAGLGGEFDSYEDFAGVYCG